MSDMDFDIQFGELEEAQPDPRLRPDRNKQFAVAPYESPVDEDLPIFVDMEVMRDMEIHAQSDTTVELGGVLLGGQYEDQEGRPFVVITDSLRAQHYEATKGSFKFTHDTWEQITRQREDFPDDLQMVGWYHTHPDWGVFLSGMDMFICDNFFNKPLDVALVIDPCRGDRGMFQWTGDPSERVRRTGGFFLTASRFRQQELELFSAQLEGKLTMTNDPRFSGFPSPTINIPAPVVNIPEQRNPWQGLAVMGMLTMQFFVVALIAWKLLLPAVPAETSTDKDKKQIAQLEKKIDRLIEARRAEALVDAKLDVLNRIIEDENGQQGIVRQMVQQEKKIDELTGDLQGYRAAGKQYQQERRQHDKALSMAVGLEKSKQRLLDIAKKDLLKTSKELKTTRKQLADLAKKTGVGKQKDDKSKNGESESAGIFGGKNLWLYAAVGLATILLVGGMVVGVAMRKDDETTEEDEDFDNPTSADIIDDQPGEEAP